MKSKIGKRFIQQVVQRAAEGTFAETYQFDCFKDETVVSAAYVEGQLRHEEPCIVFQVERVGPRHQRIEQDSFLCQLLAESGVVKREVKLIDSHSEYTTNDKYLTTFVIDGQIISLILVDGNL